MGRHTGAAFPFSVGITGVLGPKTDEEVIATSIRNIILTPQGRQPYDPTIGSLIPSLVFEPNDVITLQLVRYYTKKALDEQEPRIDVTGVLVQRPGDHVISLRVGYIIRGDPERQQRVIPVNVTREQF